jgi:hypothetical protein
VNLLLRGVQIMHTPVFVCFAGCFHEVHPPAAERWSARTPHWMVDNHLISPSSSFHSAMTDPM